ncbi:MAG: hypothetical protein ACJ74H_02785 [Thermoanaerobaculia bacterium]
MLVSRGQAADAVLRWTDRAAQRHELRRAVNVLCVEGGLAPFSFLDATLTGVKIKAAHLTELRTALNAARAAKGRDGATQRVDAVTQRLCSSWRGTPFARTIGDADASAHRADPPDSQ